MLLTTLLTAKTLAVGLALLVFKIAAGSAKLASFFTQLKHSKEDHHGYSSAWTPHYEHHDYHIEHHPDEHGTISHPGWTPNYIPHHYHEYKNEFHDYKNNEFHETKNDEFHNYNTHDDNDYKTITTHDIQGSYEDYNHLEGAKKKLDSKVG
ncbi:histidine-rich glycoprotein-like [Cydia splendana]|uniref:histidine-rich glycoprotein-like n=1 Tax=Cydia splendana TaxID=1100963 RepID=UPI00300C469E